MTFLRRVLFADAIASFGSAALMIAASGPLAGLTGLPPALLFEAGVVLVPFVLLVLWVATRPEIPRVGVKAIVAINVVWVIGSVAVLAGVSGAPTAIGYAFVAVQALAVGVLAELQVVGLKRSRQTA
jgi:hypothetical protein